MPAACRRWRLCLVGRREVEDASVPTPARNLRLPRARRRAEEEASGEGPAAARPPSTPPASRTAGACRAPGSPAQTPPALPGDAAAGASEALGEAEAEPSINPSDVVVSTDSDFISVLPPEALSSRADELEALRSELREARAAAERAERALEAVTLRAEEAERVALELREKLGHAEAKVVELRGEQAKAEAKEEPRAAAVAEAELRVAEAKEEEAKQEPRAGEAAETELRTAKATKQEEAKADPSALEVAEVELRSAEAKGEEAEEDPPAAAVAEAELKAAEAKEEEAKEELRAALAAAAGARASEAKEEPKSTEVSEVEPTAAEANQQLAAEAKEQEAAEAKEQAEQPPPQAAPPQAAPLQAAPLPPSPEGRRRARCSGGRAREAQAEEAEPGSSGPTSGSFQSLAVRPSVRRESRMSSTVLDRVRDADAALLLDDIEECHATVGDIQDAAKELHAWAETLPQDLESWWLAPPDYVESLGALLSRASEALRAAGLQLLPLAERLQLERQVPLDAIPEDEAGRRALAAARLRLAPGGLVAVADWGAARRGMRLLRIGASELSDGTTLEQVLPKLRRGTALTFAGIAVSSIAAALQELLEDFAAAEGMTRLDSSGALPAAGPPALAGVAGRLDAEAPDERLLSAWEARLLWGAQLASFESVRQKVAKAASVYIEQAERKEKPAALPEPATAKGDVPGGKGSRPPGKGGPPPPPLKGAGKGPAIASGEGTSQVPSSVGAGKGKGGPPPPPGKGGLPPPAAGKGGPPPPAKGPGKASKGPGKGAPPPPAKGAGKSSKAGPATSAEPTHLPDPASQDPVLQAVERRRGQPLFGQRTRKPDQTMLASQRRKFLTFVDSCYTEQAVAEIGDAFGGRGKLLLHACIAEAPQQRMRNPTGLEQGTQDLPPPLVQVIRGEEGKMGDKRRMDQEIRLRKFAPCGPGCAGHGLALPPAGTACRPAHELARALAGVDAAGVRRCATAAELDVGAFLPEASPAEGDEQGRADTERIEQAFLQPGERRELLELARKGGLAEDGDGGDPGASVEQLHSLERRLLPFSHVACFAEKVKLYHLCTGYAAVEEEVLEGFSLVERACVAVRTSRPLLDLLSVTLQIASYVKNFGETDLKGQGFSLMRLQFYEGFWVGRQPFLAVLAAFLRNLRPHEPVEGAGAGGATARAAVGLAATAAGEASPRRRSAGPRTAPNQHQQATPRAYASVGAKSRNRVSFMDRLEKDLVDARKAFKQNMTVPQLEAQVGRFETMAHFVEKRLASEAELFAPEAPAGFPHERAAELAAWAGGRERLCRALEELRGIQLRLRDFAARLRASERLLQEFAAVREEDFGKDGYLQVFGSVLKFVDQLKKTWLQQEASPEVHRALQQSLLVAAPLQMLFGEDCLEEAFKLWLGKASAQTAPSCDWNEEVKQDTLQRLFMLFDTNADGSIDAEELRVTLKAFGIDLPEGSEIHLEVVRHFDINGDGQMDLSEFRLFVESRIQAAFRLFLQGRPSASLEAEAAAEGEAEIAAIGEADLQRVADVLGHGGLAAETFQAMIHILDTEGSVKDDRVNLEEFEQLVLMRPDPPATRSTSDVHVLNQAVGTTGSPRKQSRPFAWDGLESPRPAEFTSPRRVVGEGGGAAGEASGRPPLRAFVPPLPTLAAAASTAAETGAARPLGCPGASPRGAASSPTASSTSGASPAAATARSGGGGQESAEASPRAEEAAEEGATKPRLSANTSMRLKMAERRRLLEGDDAA